MQLPYTALFATTSVSDCQYPLWICKRILTVAIKHPHSTCLRTLHLKHPNSPPQPSDTKHQFFNLTLQTDPKDTKRTPRISCRGGRERRCRFESSNKNLLNRPLMVSHGHCSHVDIPSSVDTTAESSSRRYRTWSVNLQVPRSLPTVDPLQTLERVPITHAEAELNRRNGHY